MRFHSEENGAGVSIQQYVIPAAKNYQYLGATLNDTDNHLDNHEDRLRLTGRQNAAVMNYKAPWEFNKNEVVQRYLKGVWSPQ